jgi:hypothetical protein
VRRPRYANIAPSTSTAIALRHPDEVFGTDTCEPIIKDVFNDFVEQFPLARRRWEPRIVKQSFHITLRSFQSTTNCPSLRGTLQRRWNLTLYSFDRFSRSACPLGLGPKSNLTKIRFDGIGSVQTGGTDPTARSVSRAGSSRSDHRATPAPMEARPARNPSWG